MLLEEAFLKNVLYKAKFKRRKLNAVIYPEHYSFAAASGLFVLPCNVMT